MRPHTRDTVGAQVTVDMSIVPMVRSSDPRRDQVAAGLLKEVPGILGAKAGARPKSMALVLVYGDGSMSFLLGAKDGDGAADLQARVYSTIHEQVAAMSDAVSPQDAETKPGPLEEDQDLGPESSDGPVSDPETDEP